MKREKKRIILLGSVIISIIFGGVIGFFLYSIYFPETATYKRTLKVGMYDNEPKVFKDKEGNVKGLFPEILEYIAQEEKWKIEWVEGDWTTCLERLEEGKIDIMIDVAYSDDRAEKYDFNNVEVLNNWGIVYGEKGSSIASIDDLEGKKIAVMAGSIHTVGDEGIINLTKKWDVDCTFIEVDDYKEVLDKLEDNKADAGVVNRLYGLFHEEDYDNIERTSIMFNPSRLLFAFHKGAKQNPELIAAIDKNLLELKDDTDSIYYQLIQTYVYGEEAGTVPDWVYPALFFAFGLVGIFITSSYMFKRMVNKRTIELQKAHDNLERKVEERTHELSLANERLKSLDELKSMFIANMSHELRTPLTSIIGFTSTIIKGWAGDVSEEQEKQLSIVLKSANHLLSLINDIIDVSKIEAGKIDIQISEFKLGELLKDLKDTFRIQAENKNIKLIMEDIDEEFVLLSDKKRINQILMNIIGNAIKFTDEGYIKVQVEEIGNFFKVIVEDTGVGMKTEDLKKLFKPFSRVIGPEQFREGTGLGLHLSQKLATFLGGRIEVESGYGKGSKFTLFITKNYKKKEVIKNEEYSCS
ncbi:MAG: ATP-binding protein [Promethearchaeota archaeon]